MTRDIVFDVDISQPIVPIQLHEPLYYQNNNAHRIVINLTKNGVEYTPASGHTVTGYFVNEVEQKTQPLGGSISGSHLYVTLIQACYAVPTRGYILVNLSKTGSGASTTTVLYLAVNVLRSKTDAIVDPGGTIPDIDTLRAYVTTMQNATNAAETARDQANAAAARAEIAADSLQDMVDTAVNNAGYPYTASGSSVTIHPVADSRIDFVAHINPIQAGSGDPSPSNVRALSAPESVTIKRFGANLLNKTGISSSSGTVAQTDTGITIATASAAKFVSAQYGGLTPHLVDGVMYTISANITALTARARIQLRGISSSDSIYQDRTTTGILSLTFTWDSSKYDVLQFFCTYTAASVGSVTYDDIMLVQGDTAAGEYVPFVPWKSVTLTLPEGAYGGDYDSHGSFVPMRFGNVSSGSRTYANFGSKAGNLYIRNMLASDLTDADTSIADVSRYFCTMYKPMPYVGIDDRQNGCVYFGYGAIYICDTAHMTAQTAAGLDAYFSWLDSVGGMNICAPYLPSKAPAATAVDAKTLRAASPAQLNHVWANNGTLTVSGATDFKWLVDSIEGS